MRQVLQIGLSQTKTHFLQLREFCLSCRHVAASQPHTPMHRMYLGTRNTHSLVPQYQCRPLVHHRDKHTVLGSHYRALRGMARSSQPDTASELSLSLENERVQEYLRRLRQECEASLQQGPGEAGGWAVALARLLGQVEQLQSEIKELSALANNTEGDKEMQDLAREELQLTRDKLDELQEEVFCAIIPEEAMDGRSVAVEVSAGIGGQEAMLFCLEVFNMYLSYARHRGWQQEVTDYETTDIGGLRHGALILSGEDVYTSLKYEGGTHRVQRVPRTEKAGRVHTSTVSVAVLPQPTEIDIQLLDKDLKIETKRAGGAGGQHVNTTDSAVRIIHLPTGLTVESQSQRSQHMNREYCLKKLRALLYQQQLEHNTQKYNSNRKLQIGTKGRSEKIRTYNFPQDRITDHRLGISIHNLTAFMDGTNTFHGLVSQLVEEGHREALQEIIYGSTKN